MKHHGITLKHSLLAVAIAIGLASANGFSQDADPFPQGDNPFGQNTPSAKNTPAAKPRVEELSLKQRMANSRIDVQILNPMAITTFLETIQDQVPFALNFVVAQSARTVMIPEMELGDVSLQAALNAAALATEDAFDWEFNEGEEMLFIYRADNYEEPVETVTVVNATDILAGTEEASLLSAIEIGLELRNSSKENVTIKLHKETKLLFIKGVEADIDIVMQILAQLGSKPLSAKNSQSRSERVEDGFGDGGGMGMDDEHEGERGGGVF